MFIDRVTVKCQFSETTIHGGPSIMMADAAIDENNVTTFTLACAETELVSVLTFGNSLAFPFSSGSSEDIGETTCVPALRDGAAVTCAWEGGADGVRRVPCWDAVRRRGYRGADPVHLRPRVFGRGRHRRVRHGAVQQSGKRRCVRTVPRGEEVSDGGDRLPGGVPRGNVLIRVRT